MILNPTFKWADGKIVLIEADLLPDACTNCPYWRTDMKTLEDGKCSITGYAIKANGIQKEGRMDDCPIRLRKYHRKID